MIFNQLIDPKNDIAPPEASSIQSQELLNFALLKLPALHDKFSNFLVPAAKLHPQPSQ